MDRSLYNMISGLGRPSVCICGDFMLDTYVSGQVCRVSPEAPIPVLHAEGKNHRPGGAGSVAAMLRALECDVCCVGLLGADTAGGKLQEQLGGCGCDVSGLVADAERITTQKTRFMGYVYSAGRGLQQMMRVDEETVRPVSDKLAGRILEHILRLAPGSDLILIQDMAKGMFTMSVLQRIIEAARSSGKPVIIDPSIKQDYFAYRNATCILPNRMETEHALGCSMLNEDDYAAAAARLIDSLDLEFVVITLDREGCYYATGAGDGGLIPTVPRSVLDVTGAGDMVAAMLSLALAGGAGIKNAVRLANAAAGIEVARQGAAPVSRAEIEAELRLGETPAAVKVKGGGEIAGIVRQIRDGGETIAFTNGVFDLLHLGHVELIRFAAEQADRLIVGLNSDRSVRAYKGSERPVTPQDVRAQTLAAMPNVDYVVIFDDPSVYALIEKIRPEVLVKGGDYARKEEVVGWDIVEGGGGKVMRAPHVKGYSTTEIIRKIRGKDGSDER